MLEWVASGVWSSLAIGCRVGAMVKEPSGDVMRLLLVLVWFDVVDSVMGMESIVMN